MSSSATPVKISAKNPPRSIYGCTLSELEDWLVENGEKKFRAKQIWTHLYKQRQNINDITTLPEALKKKLLKEFPPSLNVKTHQVSSDGTNKWLYELGDGLFIETVLMQYSDRATVCISSQAGCAMGCTFCATGQAGFDRHLSVSEIVEQVALTSQFCDVRVSNIVFMGMGEPLANVDIVHEACQRFANDMNFSARQITVSTVGVVPGIKSMATWDIPVTLAVSLHTPYDDLRSELVPLNRRYPIKEVLSAAQEFSFVHKRRVSFEYAAIDHTNITQDCAHDLGRLLSNFRGSGGAHLNLIPLNSTKNFDGKAPLASLIKEFAEIVESYGISVTIRKNRGNDIDAACGQLRERETLSS